MSKARRRRQAPDRRLSVRSIRRDPPDFRAIGRAIVALAMAQSEADAQAHHAAVEDRRDAKRFSGPPSVGGAPEVEEPADGR
jgi:hypothetical protein